MQEARQTLDDLHLSLEKVSDKMNKVAKYFCQETKKFKLEELFVDMLAFLRELENANKVVTCRSHDSRYMLSHDFQVYVHEVT